MKLAVIFIHLGMAWETKDITGAFPFCSKGALIHSQSMQFEWEIPHTIAKNSDLTVLPATASPASSSQAWVPDRTRGDKRAETSRGQTHHKTHYKSTIKTKARSSSWRACQSADALCDKNKSICSWMLHRLRVPEFPLCSPM